MSAKRTFPMLWKGESMPPDNGDVLQFLGMNERKMLEKLANRSGRTELEELKWLIRSRAFGHLKDLGDDRGSFRVYETDLVPGIHVDSVEIRR